MNSRKPPAAPYPGFYQTAYVTNDFSRALAQFRMTHGIERFLELHAVEVALGPGRKVTLNVALARVGAAEIEVIEALSGEVGLHREFLPKDSFAVTMHHVARRVATQESYDRMLEECLRSGRSVPLNGGSEGLARYFYADYRKELGHYIEHTVLTEQGVAWQAQVPCY